MPAGSMRILTKAPCGVDLKAQVIRVPTGCQDYYPALYGAVNAIQLTPDGILRELLDVPLEELEQRMALVCAGASRQSGIPNWQAAKSYTDGGRGGQVLPVRVAHRGLETRSLDGSQ
jgi:galactokinase/mevalonate kinase-like predicted kinase